MSALVVIELACCKSELSFCDRAFTPSSDCWCSRFPSSSFTSAKSRLVFRSIFLQHSKSMNLCCCSRRSVSVVDSNGSVSPVLLKSSSFDLFWVPDFLLVAIVFFFHNLERCSRIVSSLLSYLEIAVSRNLSRFAVLSSASARSTLNFIHRCSLTISGLFSSNSTSCLPCLMASLEGYTVAVAMRRCFALRTVSKLSDSCLVFSSAATLVARDLLRKSFFFSTAWAIMPSASRFWLRGNFPGCFNFSFA